MALVCQYGVRCTFTNRQRDWRRWKRRRLAGSFASLWLIRFRSLISWRDCFTHTYCSSLDLKKYQTCPMLSRHQSLWKMQSLGTEWNMTILPFKENCKMKFYCCQQFSLDELANLEEFFVSDSFLVTLLLPTLSRICIDNDPRKMIYHYDCGWNEVFSLTMWSSFCKEKGFAYIFVLCMRRVNI